MTSHDDQCPVEWRKVRNWDLYEVSNTGLVRNTRTNAILKSWIAPTGYPMVNLWKSQKRSLGIPSIRGRFFVHRLVCEAFNGPAPDSRHEVAHFNGIRSDNVSTNLRWATRSENIADSQRHGTKPKGSKSSTAKINEALALRIFHDRRTQSEIADEAGICQQTVSEIKRKLIWRHIHETP